jgi:hypothetical protein
MLYVVLNLSDGARQGQPADEMLGHGMVIYDSPSMLGAAIYSEELNALTAARVAFEVRRWPELSGLGFDPEAYS